MTSADNARTNSVKVINVWHAGCSVDKLTGYSLYWYVVCRIMSAEN